jgi:hypothetical protein
MKTYGGVNVQIHVLLISVLVGGEWLVSSPDSFIPEKRASRTHLIGDWVAPRTSVDDANKRKILPLLGLDLRPWPPKPVASRDTYCFDESSSGHSTIFLLRIYRIPNNFPTHKCHCLINYLVTETGS